MDTRRLISALFAGLAVYFLASMIINRLLPPPPAPPPQSQPAENPASAPASGPTTSASASRPGLVLTSAQPSEPVELGGGNEDELRVELTPIGGSVTTLDLVGRDGARYRHRNSPDGNEPYQLLKPVDDGRQWSASYGTRRVWVDGAEYRAGDLIWNVAEKSPRRVEFETVLKSPAGQDVVALRKTFDLEPGKPLMRLTQAFENRSGAPVRVAYELDGAVGVPREPMQQYEVRRVVWALRTYDGKSGAATGIKLDHVERTSLRGGKERFIGSSTREEQVVWAAAANKYFCAITRPLSEKGDADFLSRVYAVVAAPNTEENQGDVLARFVTQERILEAGQSLAHRYELYAGAKDADELRAVNPAFVDRAALGYIGVHDFDSSSCCCSFIWLTELMSWLLNVIEKVVRNYGLAIIVLVLIIRALLHPLAVFQQKSMYRMQAVQVRLGPKIAELKEKFAGDKARLNQEMMRLYGEENVNPAAGLISFVPLFLQMPILIALWSGLNSNVNLRHAPFDGWWIRDLSAPDALITFGGEGLTIPVLGWVLPFMFAHIPAFNLLPILMGVSMFLQQKYMPKPAQELKRQATGGKQHKDALGMTPEEQLRQQQMMSYMMTIMFPLMFYYMPAGLNLYWMITNVFGIVESLIIRKQIRQEKERAERLGPQPPKPAGPGFLSRMLKQMAERAENLQRQADEASGRQKSGRPLNRERKDDSGRTKRKGGA